MRRWLAIVVALGLVPGTYVRIEPNKVESPWVTFERLALPESAVGPFTVEEAWQLTSADTRFGGYSALASLGPGEFLALTDRGTELRFASPRAGKARLPFGLLLHFPDPWWNLRDFEALARDPRTGTVWAAFEGRPGLASVATDGRERIGYPRAMRRWGDNSGAEAMARLPDGRFVILAEGGSGWGSQTSPGLLYPADPLSGVEPLEFRLSLEDRYRPTDLAVLPDGRLLLLARRLEIAFPPRFSARLLLTDASAIGRDRVLAPQPLATIADPLPSENFEGLTVERSDQGRWAAWIMSDDNFSPLQRTVLLKLSFEPAALGE